jgi:hypothetical protein
MLFWKTKKNWTHYLLKLGVVKLAVASLTYKKEGGGPFHPTTSLLSLSSVLPHPLYIIWHPKVSTQPSSQHDSSRVIPNYDVIPFDLIWEYINGPVEAQIEERIRTQIQEQQRAPRS